MNTLERALIEKAGCEHGWEVVLESNDDQLVLASARHRARVRIFPLAPHQGWWIEVPSGLIRQELDRSLPNSFQTDGHFTVSSIDQLARLLRRAAELAQSLPNQAALMFNKRVKAALQDVQANATEVERLVKQRVGQDTFREALMDYWGGGCAVTGIKVPEILRASHAKPWADCETDEERLDVFNGFLLCANLDALFDRGLITFDGAGHVICSPRLTQEQCASLQLDSSLTLRWLAPEHSHYLDWHRVKVFLDHQ